MIIAFGAAGSSRPKLTLEGYGRGSALRIKPIVVTLMFNLHRYSSDCQALVGP
jgi:hypothetical protein